MAVPLFQRQWKLLFFLFNDTLKNLEDNEFSNSLWFLDNRKIFRPTEYDPDVEINLLK